MTTTINNEHKELNFSSEREQSQTCLNSAEHEKNQGRKVLNVPNLRFPEFVGEWEKCKLEDVMNFSTTRVNSSELNEDNYVSTENMLQDYQGIVEAKSVPEDVNVISFSCGNILISNIRPYLKKVWKATFNGGCSSDVFVLKANDNIESDYLHYVIANDKFINFVMSGAKGVKMPRGDKKQMKTYSLSLPQIQEQHKIARLLSLLDERITTQNKIIEDLKKLKSAISKQVFAKDPNGWNRLDTLFSKGKAGGTPTSTKKEYYNGDIPFLSINDITRQGKFIRNTENHLSQSGLENSSAWVVPRYSLIISMYASVGLVTINDVPLTTSQAMFAMQLKEKDLLDYLYYYLLYFKYRHIHKYLETCTQSNINADIVRGIMIPTYGYSHNVKIASTLQSVDTKIDNEFSVLEQFNRQKSYFLSQMFI